MTYDDRFQRLKGRVDALDTVAAQVDQERVLDPAATSVAAAGTAGPDYAAIVEEGRALLREASKDLRVVCYVALARLHTHGLHGLAEGVAALEAFTETFWADGFPPPRRARARGAALRFFVRRAADHLEATPGPSSPGQAEREAVCVALQRLERLRDFWRGELGAAAPATARLARGLRERAEASPVEDADSPAEVSHGAEEKRADRDDAPRHVVRGPEAPDAGVPDADPVSLMAIERNVLGLVVRAQAIDAERSRWYRVERALRWDPLRALPPHREGRTHVTPPSAQRMQALRDLARRGQHVALGREAEKAFAQPPFHLWLDLQRLQADALAASGATAVREALLGEVRRLLRRLPALAGLTFDDGTPLADAATRAWIDEAVLRDRESRAEGGLAASAQERSIQEDPVEASYEAAKGRLRDGTFEEALCLLRDAPLRPATGRARFRLQLRMAALCLQGGRPVLARPLLEALGETVQERGIDHWEPELAAAVWTALHDCYRVLEQAGAMPSEEARVRQAATHARLCRVDVCRAQMLGGGAQASDVVEEGRTDGKI